MALRIWLGRISENKVFLALGVGLLSLALATLAAYVSYNLYERQFLRLKRYFKYVKPHDESCPTATEA